MFNRGLNRRKFMQLAAGTSLGAALVGCAPAGQQTTVTQDSQTTVEFWDWDHEPRVDFLNRLITEFQEEHPDVNLKYNPLPWTDIETKLLTVATAGSGPAFSNVHFFWRYDLQRAGALAPYPDDMFDWDQLLSTPFNRDPETGDIYTCDFNFYCDMLYFNSELLDEEGISPDEIPNNWDDFIVMAQQLTKTDDSGDVTQVGCSLNDYWAREWLWHTLVYQQGGWLYNEAGDQALWNNEEGVPALQFIQDWYYEWQLDDPDFLGQGEAFGNGRAGSFINQGYSAAGINTEYPQMEGNWATKPTPTFTGGPDPAWGMAVPEEGFAVFSSFPPEVQEKAFEFIEFTISGDERRLDWALLMDGPPDRIDLLDHERIQSEDTANTIASQAETMPWRIIYGERPLEAEKFWRTMFDRVILEQVPPKEALDEATEQMNAALQQSDVRRTIVERNYQPPS